ncbi:hypothetical protein ACQKGD_27625 [Peribacillus frigoritolerans]|uniref:hypothetical protein n=1 Tax=Peribacillus frigoritolerans TaxID=450367 RepID=UPI003D06CC0A
MFPKQNELIRRIMSQNKNLKYWMVAYNLGIDSTTLSRWLRHELPEEKKREILNVINELKAEMQKESQ